MTTGEMELPDAWERGYSTDKSSVTGTYQHKYLDVELQLLKHDPAELGKHVDGDGIYDYFLQWGGELGGVETTFDPPGEVTTATEAVNWAIALMNQISKQYEPGDTDYVSRAIRATKGEDVDSPKSNSSRGSHRDATTCPVCGAFFFQFRGFDTHEQAQDHFEFMGDEEHKDWDISLSESKDR